MISRWIIAIIGLGVVFQNAQASHLTEAKCIDVMAMMAKLKAGPLDRSAIQNSETVADQRMNQLIDAAAQYPDVVIFSGQIEGKKTVGKALRVIDEQHRLSPDPATSVFPRFKTSLIEPWKNALKTQRWEQLKSGLQGLGINLGYYAYIAAKYPRAPIPSVIQHILPMCIMIQCAIHAAAYLSPVLEGYGKSWKAWRAEKKKMKALPPAEPWQIDPITWHWAGGLSRQNAGSDSRPLSIGIRLDTTGKNRPRLRVVAVDAAALEAKNAPERQLDKASEKKPVVFSVRPNRKRSPVPENPESETPPEEGSHPTIKHFEDPELQEFYLATKFAKDAVRLASARGFPWQRYAKKVIRILDLLNSVSNLSALKERLGAHHLKNYAEHGFRAIEIDKQWRLLFRWDEGESGPTIIGIEDYHAESTGRHGSK